MSSGYHGEAAGKSVSFYMKYCVRSLLIGTILNKLHEIKHLTTEGPHQNTLYAFVWGRGLKKMGGKKLSNNIFNFQGQVKRRRSI